MSKGDSVATSSRGIPDVPSFVNVISIQQNLVVLLEIQYMNIGIIGTGSVGSALATGLKAAGHYTVVGSRDPDANEVEGVEVVTSTTLSLFTSSTLCSRAG